MIQSDGRGAKYKFIDAPYNPEFYIDENSIPRDSASVTQLYRNEAEPSKLMGLTITAILFNASLLVVAKMVASFAKSICYGLRAYNSYRKSY